jgi:hypothetical protein
MILAEIRGVGYFVKVFRVNGTVATHVFVSDTFARFFRALKRVIDDTIGCKGLVACSSRPTSGIWGKTVRGPARTVPSRLGNAPNLKVALVGVNCRLSSMARHILREKLESHV